MSENPMYPDAPTTSPGGMKRAALVAEMVTLHGWDEDEAKRMRWPDQIDAVIEGRLEREAKAKGILILGVDADVDDTILHQAFHVHTIEGRCIKNRSGVQCEQGEDLAIPSTVNTALFIGMPDTRDFIFDGHAGAGPSGAERWMNCTASLHAAREFLETLSLNQQVQFAGANGAARQGTTAHAAAEVEANLILGRTTQEEADQTLLELAIMPDTDGEAYDDEMAEYITEYTDLVRQYADDRGSDHIMIEARVAAVIPINNWEDTHEIRGSADFVAMPTPTEPTLVVGDLKYGNGVDVDVDENPQIRIYALGVLSELADEDGNLPDLDGIVYYIVQPRLGGIKPWEESVDDLLRWRDEVLSPALSLALAGPAGGATYSPSELACQWCPARGGCSALAEQRMDAASSLFDVIVESEFADGPGAFPETSTLTDERLGSLLTQINGLTGIAKDLKAEVQRRLHRGTPVPGFKLVSYTPARKWKPEAAEALKYSKVPGIWEEPTLVTPTQALKIMEKAAKDPVNEVTVDLTELIEVPGKRPIAAPEGDRRKTWEGTRPEEMFPDVEGEEA